MANRAPTPAELSCADATAPCSLTNFFVGDPALKQVVAHTVEAGLRGERPFMGGRLRLEPGFYRTVSDDDIQFVASPILGRAFFRNVGRTRRQGIDASVEFRARELVRRALLFLDRRHLPDAADPQQPRQSRWPMPTVRYPVQSRRPCPGHRAAYLQGRARAGRRAPRLELRAALAVAAGQYLTGDEANLTPTTGTYAVADLGADYALTERLNVSRI